MAATWIKPLHVNKGKTIAKTITNRTDYAENPDKTRKGELVTGYECDPHTADTEFLLAKQEYTAITGKNQGKRDILAYHIRQSFKPGEISPEQANKLGYDLAMRFTKGKHSFIVATHEDKQHIHNHIIFNSTTLDCTRKFKNPLRSNKIIRRISDQISLENGLSVIENPKPSRGHYGAWLGDRKELSWREKLEQLIDKVLAEKPANRDEFIKLLKAENCAVKQGKHLSLRMEGQKRFTRLKSLSADYTEDAIRERISGQRTVKPKEASLPGQPKKINLLIDLQNSIKAVQSPGYERWAKIFNVKQAAQSILFLQENDITDLEQLAEEAQGAKDNFNRISARIQTIDARLADINALQKHIGAYIKTKSIYVGYRKAGYSKKYLAEHEGAISAHKAAKKFFDEQKLVKLPAIKTLQQEFASLTVEKKKLYSEYHAARKYMQEILTVKQNTTQFLAYRDTVQTKQNERG